MADRGLSLLGQDGERGARLRVVQSLYGFLERDYPRLIDRWEQEYYSAGN